MASRIVWLFFCIAVIGFAFSSACSKKSTGPPPDNTVDTTSHDFVWQVKALGDLTSSLSDVFEISEDNIWAVGRIQIEDSLGNDIVYNAANWSGVEWRLRRFTNTDGNPIIPIRSIFYFSNNNIWLVAGSIYHWDGNVAEISYQRDINTSELVQRLWVCSPNDIYGVGTEGLVVNYNGTDWQQESSGVDTRLVDVWGNAAGTHVWACGYASNNSESVLLHRSGGQWQTAWRWHHQDGSSDSSYVGLLSSLWAVDEDSLIIVSGDGVFRQDIRGNSPPRKEPLTLDAFPLCVRGSAANNIFICGDNGRIWHFNGASWKTYPELHNPNWVWRSIAVLENQVIAVGEDYSQVVQRDIILRGERINQE